MSNRSSPKRHARATGSIAARRIAFMPCVSETFRPNSTRSSNANVAVTSWRSGGRSSWAPAPRFVPDDDRGAAGGGDSRDRGVEEREVVEVDVEVHDGFAAGREQARRASAAP